MRFEKCSLREFPSGQVVRSALSLLRTRVQSLVRQLRSLKLHSAAKNNKKKFPLNNLYNLLHVQHMKSIFLNKSKLTFICYSFEFFL